MFRHAILVRALMHEQVAMNSLHIDTCLSLYGLNLGVYIFSQCTDKQCIALQLDILLVPMNVWVE